MPRVPPSLVSSLMSIRPPSNKLIILRILNILTFLLILFSSVYFEVFSHPSSGDISNKYPTYFTPSLTFVEIFWSILFFLQSGFAFYSQFKELNLIQDVVKTILNLWLSLSNLFVCGWLFFWVSLRF